MSKIENLSHLGKSLLLLSLLNLFSLAALAQSIVKGIVKDSSGEPVIGATVRVSGAKTGTVTDLDGNFSISAPAQGTLSISYIGYETQNVAINGRNNIEVTLKEENTTLNDVVVIGYGVQKKSDLTGSIASVNSDDIKGLATSDAAAALQGKASGVQIVTSNAAPGTGATIRLRGYSSNSGNLGPLLIVDGLQVDNIQYLDPSMIKSIEVLKDAASAAIYGAQAGNGVVLITTKDGSGHSSITYDGKWEIQSLANKPKIFDAQGWINYKRASGLPIDDYLKQYNYDGTDTDWFDVVFGNSLSQKHALTFQGSNDKGKFFLSLNYLDNNGIVKGDKDRYKRLTAQINADYKIKPWLTVGTTNSFEKYRIQSVPDQTQYGSLMSSCVTLDPLTPVYYSSPDEFPTTMKAAYDQGKNILKDPSNGLYYATSKYITDDSGNPLLQRDREDKYTKGINLRGMVYANFMPFKGFVFTSRFGYRVEQSNYHRYATPYYATPQAHDDNYHIEATANTNYYYQWENFANYNITIAKKHDLTAMAGMSYIQYRDDNVGATAQGPDVLTGYESNFHYINYVNGNDDTVKGISNAPGRTAQLAYFGRLIYTYDNRYSIQANFRADAFDSSKLSKDNRWGYFPSFSAGWTVSNEKFISDNISRDILSFLKIRASWGKNGNISVLSNYPYATSINYNGAWYQYSVTGATATYGSSPSGLANPDLKWETSEQFDLGLDARFFNDRLTFAFDYYNKTTKDLLVQISPLPEIGVSSTTINGGTVRNRGWEVELGWKDNIGDFRYSVSANGSWLKNKVTKLPSSIDRITAPDGSPNNNPVYTAFEVGYPIWYFRGYKYLGVNKETGAAILQDTNGDGQISPEDMTYIGKAIPDFTYGITINAEYKGFDLNVFGTGVTGNDIFTLFYRADTPMRNSLRYFYDHAWSAENPNGSMPDPAKVVNDWTFWASSASMFSGAYFKIKTIQLGYTIPKNITKKFAVENLRLYVSLDDFFTFTSYPGCDPETANMTGIGQQGFDLGSYPSSKKVTMGVSITF